MAEFLLAREALRESHGAPELFPEKDTYAHTHRFFSLESLQAGKIQGRPGRGMAIAAGWQSTAVWQPVLVAF